ncbi:hypothetical protein ABID19_005926, partial [Mesorhizobium robiniae]
MHYEGESWLADQEAGSWQADALPPRGQIVSNLDAGPGKRRIDDVSAQHDQHAISETQLNVALHDIYAARDIGRFSRAVVEHDRVLQRAGHANHAMFLQKAAARFARDFVPNWENDVRAWKSWGYATTCNAVSREAGGQAGIEACRAMAARVSQLSDALVNEVEGKALSLFASSFGRHSRAAECRNGMIRIAKVCRDESGILEELNSQSLGLLVNGFSKWPQESTPRQATLAIAAEICRRARQLSDFPSQNLSTLVNGFSKWAEPNARQALTAIAGEVLRRSRRRNVWLSDFGHQELSNMVNGFAKWPEDCRGALVAIASEVSHRAGVPDARFSAFTSQGLANLVNGFCKCPEEEVFCQATVAIAGEVLRRNRRARLSEFTQQEMANLVNGFSKWPQEAASREAAGAMAGEVLRRADRQTARLPGFNPQHLANLVNGFSKWPQEEWARHVIGAIAGQVGRRVAPGEFGLSDFNHQDLANMVNGFSKWPDEAVYRQATIKIATELSRRAREQGLADFTPQELANLVNGFSKCPDDADYHQATVVIAREVIRRRAQLRGFSYQNLTNLVNGFSKWPQQANCRDATLAIAREVTRRDDPLSHVSRQHLSNLVNAFSKWPQEADCRQATVAIAGEVLRRASGPSDFTPQDMVDMVNGFSKWPERAQCRQAAVALGVGLLGRADRADRLSDFAPQGLANLANGFSKWSDGTDCRDATVAIAGEVLRRVDKLSDFIPQHLANLVNGFGKWPEAVECRQATVAIAGEVLGRADELADFIPQHLANLMNGFSRWPEEAACHQAIMDIARRLGSAGLRFAAFTTPALSTIANDLARECKRGEGSGEITETALLRDRLHQLAHHLHYATDRLERADALGITNIFRALAKARLFDDLGSLARAGLDRLQELHRAPGFATENNLESMGNLCAALLPLARSPHKQLRWHRRQALNLLKDIQPVVKHKIEAHLQASNAEQTRGPCSSRCPALSIYQVLKARAVLESLYRRPYVEGRKPDLRMTQQQLQRETRQILASTRNLIEADLSNMSWNVIAEIEADSPVDALDTFMAHNAATVQAQHPASVFDVHQVLQAMDHEPRPPQGDAGLMQLPVVDIRGQRVATEPETRYSAFHRLTSGAIKAVAVQLPGKPSAFMLARTVTVEGVPYRMDLFGGSKLKAPQPTVSQIAARSPDAAPARASGGKLLAIPYAETAPGTAFEQLSRAWAPFKEAYYYTQRRGFAAPPALQGLGPHDYALEGAFKLSLLPDRPANEQHPFKLTGKAGPIALRPHDGCGFIKASLAARMPTVRRAGQTGDPDRVAAFGEGRRSSLPALAAQHYPRSELVADEAREKARTWLESQQGRALTSEELFRTVTAGHIDGPGAVAVPSGDGHVHVPTLKSETLTGRDGVLIGRSPYDKPNLRPFAAGQVRSAVDGDPTA